jgi:predicted SAM-dependent methyltransferase
MRILQDNKLRYRTKYKFTLKKLILNELISFIGRIFKKKIKNKNLYLNIGCGENIINNYDNLDFYSISNFFKKKIIMSDIRYPLPFYENSYLGVFCSHTIEHLDYAHAKQLLNEIKRILKPNGIVRIAVPDLEKYVEFYLNKKPFGEKQKFNEFYNFYNGCEAIWFLTNYNYHLSLWDKEMLINELKDSGFLNIRVCKFQSGLDVNLLKDIQVRDHESLYIEASK